MKHHLLRRISLTTLLTLLAVLGLKAADIAAGKVYQIVNDQYKLAMTINGPNGNVTCGTPDAKNLDQLWEAESAGDNKWAFKNLTTGTYLTSSGQQSGPWCLSASVAALGTFSLESVGTTGTITIRPASQSNWAMGFAHCDGGHTVVCWDSSSATSQWTLTQATISDADKAAAASRLEKLNNALNNAGKYSEILGRLFTDKACTTLAGTPSADDIAALPAELQAMVNKIQAGNWQESNYNDASITWADNYARKFRVQNYEVYSRGNECAELTGIQAYTNMNNPTGIMANAYDVLYIMVDQAPKDGSTLYYGHAPGRGMYNDWQTDYPLHEGLNVVPAWTDGSMGYIYYTADTYSQGERKHKLAEFPPIKIHIEGGLINSFFSSQGDELYAPDTRADFNYYRDRAQHTMFDIVGKYTILHFFWDRTETDAGNGNYCDGVKTLLGPSSELDIADVIRNWDELGITERIQMGLMSDEDILAANRNTAAGRGDWYEPLTGDDIAPSDFSEYWNNRHMGITMQGGLYMNATWWRTAYNGSTLPSILDVFNGGNIWGPAHEYGHMNQTPMKVAGTTEISNNCFSNVAVYTHTDRTSRSDMISDQVNVFNKGLTFLENGIWGTTRMYLQLWLYYHAAGHNKKFYPRLYQILREDPLEKSYYLNVRYDALKFVKACCVAAQEDLTEYFEAWGFFVPLDNYHIGDYANYYATLTSEDIAAVKKEIKAYGFPENKAMLFIDDRIRSPKESWSEWQCKERAGDLGAIEDFINGCPVTKPYTYLLSGTNITMSGGEGGVGFVIYDDKDNLIGFSNSYEFPVSTACAQALLNGTARVEAMGADSKTVKAESTLSTLTSAQQADMLRDMVENCNYYITNSDPTATVVGRFKSNYVAPLAELQAEAQDVLDKADASKYIDMYTRLANEYFDLSQNNLTHVPFVPGGTYVLTLRGIDDNFPRNLTHGARSNVQATDAKDIDDPAQQWVFEPASQGKYYIKNVKTGRYLDAPVKNQSMTSSAADKRAALSVDWKTDFNYAYIHLDGCGLNYNTGTKVIGWDAQDHWNSQWMLTKVATDELQEAIINLDETIATAKQLMNKAGNVDGAPRQITFDPQISDEVFFSNAKCKSTLYGDQFTSFIVVNDTTSSTFFHSDYSGADSDDGLDHYIGIDLGLQEDGVTPVTLTDFHIGYITRGSGNQCAPSEVTFQGSADGEKWIDLQKVTSGLPEQNDKTYISDELHSDVPVRYVRMMVHKTYGGQRAGGHYYFIVSEFMVYNTFFSGTPNAAYPSVNEDLLHEVFTAVKTGQAVYDEATTASRYKASKVNDARSALGKVVEKLAAAMGVYTGVDEVIADEAATLRPALRGIYDLQGRRLQNATAPGIYIIDGRKVMVK